MNKKIIPFILMIIMMLNSSVFAYMTVVDDIMGTSTSTGEAKSITSGVRLTPPYGGTSYIPIIDGVTYPETFLEAGEQKGPLKGHSATGMPELDGPNAYPPGGITYTEEEVIAIMEALRICRYCQKN